MILRLHSEESTAFCQVLQKREWPHVLDSNCCCNKLLKAFWLKTTQIYSYSCGGQKSEISFTELISRNRQGCFLLEALRSGSLSSSFSASGGPPTFLGMWPLPSSSEHIMPISASIITSSPPLLRPNLPLPLIRTRVIIRKTHHPVNTGSSLHLMIVSLIASAKSLLPWQVA